MFELLCVFTDLILLFYMLMYIRRKPLLFLRFTIRNTRKLCSISRCFSVITVPCPETVVAEVKD